MRSGWLWTPWSGGEAGRYTRGAFRNSIFRHFSRHFSGSTIRTLLHGKINPKDWQVLSLGDVGFLLFFRVVSGDYGKPWSLLLTWLKCSLVYWKETFFGSSSHDFKKFMICILMFTVGCGSFCGWWWQYVVAEWKQEWIRMLKWIWIPETSNAMKIWEALKVATKTSLKLR